MLELMGVKVIPILSDYSDDDLNKVLNLVSGIYFPGSWNNIFDDNFDLRENAINNYRILDYAYNLKVTQNIDIPIYSICYGFQTLYS